MKTKMTPEQIEIVRRILNSVWEEVAYDIFQCRADCGEKRPNEVRRSEVFEVACDANRPAEKCNSIEDVRAYQAFTSIPWEERKRMAKTFFPFAWYGN